MYKVVTNFKTIKRAVQTIQCRWKGHKGRIHFLETQQREKQAQQLEFFSTMATTIQKFFKGYYERKYKHDFYARKRYLENVVRKNEETLMQLDDHRKQLEIEEQKNAEDIA